MVQVSRRYTLVATCLLGLFWTVGSLDFNAPQVDRLLLLLAGCAVLGAVSVDRAAGALVTVYAVVLAFADRLSGSFIGGSDVLSVTREAIATALAGGNPYTHVMQSTNPVGSPFAYPPGEPLYYLPAYLLANGDLRMVETWSALLTVIVLAVAGLRVGHRAALPTMAYATWGTASFHTELGGNDVSAAFLVVLALVALLFGRENRFAYVASAIAFGWAIAFKQFALLVLPPVLRCLAAHDRGWRAYAIGVVATVGALSAYYFLRDPGAFVSQQLAALVFHQDLWGANLPNLFARYVGASSFPQWIVAVQLLALAAAVGASLYRPMPTLGGAALVGAGVVLVPLLLARWTTQPYYVYAGTVALAGLALLEVRWPRLGARAGAKAGS